MNSDLTISSIQDKGYRITNIRKEVINLFSTSSTPLSANEIQHFLARAGAQANIATIYREIQFLLKNGYLTEVYLSPGHTSYESSELKHHHHLICNRCGRIDNITNCLAHTLEESVYKKKGFKITKHTLEFYGLCAQCIQTT